MTPASVLRKLRGRSVTEIRLRSLQVASAWLERLGLSDEVGEPSNARFWHRLSRQTRQIAPVGDAARLLDAFRTRTNRFFAAFDDREATINELRRRWPEAEARIVAHADAIRRGVFDILGYDGISFGSPIDWHRDPVSGRVAPRVHWSRIDYLDPTIVGDHKVTWELNRHQYFITLGRAYWLTGDEAYARVIADHLVSWMDANPPKLGVNWASSLEAAYRAVSWTWALSFLRHSSVLTPELYRRVLAYLDLQARHIARHLSTFFSPNTHLTGEALGLLTIGLCFPELASSERWVSTGRTILKEEIQRQVRPDGVYVEQSPHYHRYTLDIYLHAVILAQRAGSPLGVDAPLQAALEHAMFVTMPDGSFPLVGDDDGGQLLPLDALSPNEFRPELSTAAAVYGRGDFAAVSGGLAEQTLWLLGPAGVAVHDELCPEFPRATSRAFTDGGVYVMRDGWTADSNYAYVDAGPHGFLTGGHAHADAISFVLVSSGQQLFVDPGTCVYSSTGGERDCFRATAAHNTITVDGKGSSDPGPGPFQWRSMARTTVRRWSSSPSHDFLKAGHDGFSRLADPVQHERSILFVKDRYWVIRDRLIADGTHRARLHFHCAPGVQASAEGQGAVSLLVPDGGATRAVTLAAFGPDGSFSVRQDHVCPEYGRRVQALACEYDVAVNGTTEILSFVLPAGASALHVSSDGDGVFEVRGTDLAHVHRLGCAAEADAESWTWIRRDPLTNATVEQVIVDGRAADIGESNSVDAAGPGRTRQGIAPLEATARLS